MISVRKRRAGWKTDLLVRWGGGVNGAVEVVLLGPRPAGCACKRMGRGLGLKLAQHVLVNVAEVIFQRHVSVGEKAGTHADVRVRPVLAIEGDGYRLLEGW